MLPQTVFSLDAAGAIQAAAFIVFGLFTIGFFAWVAYLVRMK